MRNHPFWARLLSLTLGLLLLFSCVGAAFAADPPGNSLEGLTEPDSPWDHYPSTDGLDQSALHTYTPEGNWAFAQAPAGTTNFTNMSDLYYIPRYSLWSVASGIAAGGGPGDVRWVSPQFRSDKSIMYSSAMPAMVYTAPVSGTINIAAAAKISVDWWEGGGPNGMRIAVYKSNQYGVIVPVWPVGERWQLLGGSAGAPGTEGNEYTFEPYEISIQAGEKLYFVMDSNGNDADDRICWEPTVAYVNDQYDAANDPALALPEKVAFADVFPFENTSDNNFEHGNGWRMDAARGDIYTPMNYVGWNTDWKQGRYFESDEAVEEGTVLWDRGVILVNDSTNSWHCDSLQMYPAAGGNDVAFTYKAPRDGVLKLSFGDASFAQEAVGNKINLAVYKNDVQIWPEEGVYTVQHDADAYDELKLALEDVVSATRAGDLFHIRASLVTSVGEYALKVMPEAEYTSLEYDADLDKEFQFQSVAKYSLKEQFSTTTQGENGWWYLYAPIGENDVTEIPGFYEWAWCAGVEDYNVPQIYADPAIMPGNMYDAIVAFKAPYTGKIKIYTEGGVWLDDSTGAGDAGDGCYYSVQLSSDGEVSELMAPVFVENGGTSEFKSIALDIRKNEYIYFRVNKGANNWHDTLNMNPAIQYSSIDFDDPGIEEGPAAEREDPAAGNSLKEDQFPLAGRDYSEAATYSLTAEELTQKIIAGDLEEGAVYEVTDHLSLYFGGISAETVFDLKNICIRTSPSGYSYDGPNPLGEGRFAIFVEGTTAPITFKNFTLEVSAWGDSDLTPEEVINTWNCAGLTLENAEIKGVTNHAVHSVNSKEGAETRLIGCRIDGAFSGGAVAFHDNSGGAAAGTPSVTSSCIVNAAAIIDINSSGAFLMNNAITAKGTAVQLGCSEAVVQNNVIAGGVEISDGLQNVLVALNQVTGGIGVLNGKNTVILLNKVDSIAATGGVSLMLAENTVSGGVSAQKVDYLLMQDNAVTGEILTTDSTNTYGDDLFDPDVRKENGVNEELLPKTNVEVFAGMTHKTTVRTEDEVQTLKRYLNLSARNNTYAIIPPGLYTADALALAGVENYDVYAYGVTVEFESYEGNVFTMNNCSDVTVYGMYISHVNNANGQATIIEKGDNYVIAQTDPGYLPDLTDETYYPTGSPYVEAFRPGETVPFADIGFQSIEYLGDGKHKCILTNDRGQELEVGGKITMRGNGTSVVVLTGCGNVRFEDFSIISGAGFGFQERNGDGGTQLYRVAITPKAAPVLAEDFDTSKYSADLIWTDDEGRLRGPNPLLSTCDATHSTNMRKGPQVVNCLFEKMTDDATNISGEFGKVTDYDPATRKLTYTKGDNYYEGLPANFQAGDTAVLFTRGGELLATAKVTAEPESGGWQVYILTLDQDVEIKSGTLIENISANGAGFLFDNCLVDTTRSRGFLLKAPDGAINNCTIRNVGMAAILVKPEIDEAWNECGYVQNLEITNNIFENTGFFNNTLKGSPVAISGDGQFTADPAFLMHQDILIQNNIIKDRNTDYAVYVNGAQRVKLLDNDFGARKGYTAETDTASSVRIDGAYDVEVSGNVYPAGAEPRVDMTAQTRKIYGADIEQQPIGNYAIVSAASVYTTEGWQVELTIENIFDETVTYTLAFADSTSKGLLADGTKIPTVTLDPGETRKLYFPVQTLPGDMVPKQTYAQTDVAVSVPSGSQGVFTNQISFNGAINVPSEDALDWTQAPGIGKEGTDRGEYIASDARFAWDSDNLYMRVVVTDDVHYDCANLGEFYDWDSLQIGFIPDRKNLEGYFVYFIGLIDGKAKLQMDTTTLSGIDLGDITASVSRDDDAQTTTYLMAIPWSLFGIEAPAGESIGFEIVVNDRDGPIVEGQEPEQWNRYFLEYYGGIAVSKNRALYGSLTLLDEPFVIPSADTSDLEAAIADAEKVDASLYTEASVKALNDAVNAAKSLLESKPIVNAQDDVDAAAKAIRDAIAALVKPADTSDLETAIADAGKVDASLYTEASVKALNDAVKAAEALLESKPTEDNQDDVDAAVKAIRDAIAALEKLPESNPGSSSGTPSSSEAPSSSETPSSGEEPSTGSAPHTLAIFLLSALSAIALLAGLLLRRARGNSSRV